MTISESNFKYNATVKLHELPPGRAHAAFPSVTDLAVSSRTFSSYVECVASARALFEDVVADVNGQNSTHYMISAEINPAYSGQETRSKDWADDELARIWIFDKSEEGAQTIRAAGQAQIFTIPREVVQLVN